MSSYQVSFSEIEKTSFNDKKFGTTKEFHISLQARKKYKLDKSYFSITGNVLFADSYAAKIFAENINNNPNKGIKGNLNAGDVNAIGLLDEILHYIIFLYKEEEDNKIIENALLFAENTVGKKEVFETVLRFVEEFPPMAVFNKEISPLELLKTREKMVSEFEEMLVLWINNLNPAYDKIKELFDDERLSDTAYNKIFDSLLSYFANESPVHFDNNLLELLLAPQKNNPDSFFDQLNYIAKRWGLKLKHLYGKALSGLDLVKEETGIRLPGPGPSLVIEPNQESDIEEVEQFSEDHNWMPETVMIAKSTHVWLYQLSKEYGYKIDTLDKIPEKELINLNRSGFNTLWLIGIWERSKASKRIKELCGNPEALSSAYSIYNYEIAYDLGGEESYNILKTNCGKYGIRLAADMVPNHFGIDSSWVHNYPERFLKLENCPFPAYSFSGEDLSSNSDIELKIEDHYYDKTDAAVVFKRVEKRNGKVDYIYHGNDGTTMPWNDTAQLDYTKKEVRNAVIDTIVEVAKKFPVIRFDAAMTLAKKHYKRLWFPAIGEGGDIPTRSEFGLSEKEFNSIMPKEFFREVVDTIAEKAPGTLLLAEAFWLMEGYFVRTLGMHRVYNSAFMNMLKNEENEKYRQSIKNILTFDKEILKRFVNFLSNPDEESAINQFGKEDKYFGACMMLATMPGLPMFAHGQIQGFSEKYGMEYKKSYKNEEIDNELIKRHEREIFPLLKNRHLFAESKNFQMYDFIVGENKVDENVFAYSNSTNEEHTICFFNNKFTETKGVIKESVLFNDNKNNVVNKKINIDQALKIQQEQNCFIVFKDLITGKEYLRNCYEVVEKGIELQLKAFKYNVFSKFRKVYDEDGLYNLVEKQLKGQGVNSIETFKEEIKFQKVYAVFEKMLVVEEFKDFEKLFKLLIAEFELLGIQFESSKEKLIINKVERYFKENIVFEKGEKYFLISVLSYFVTKKIVGNDFSKQDSILKKIIGKNLNEIDTETFLLIKILSRVVDDFGNKLMTDTTIFKEIFNYVETNEYLIVNEYEEIFYFNKEKFEEFARKIVIVLFVEDKKKQKNYFNHLVKTAYAVNYKLTKFLLLV